jgi:hypothetical protein
MDHMGNEIVLTGSGSLTETNDQMVARVAARVVAVNQIYKRILTPTTDGVGGDYGLIPGCGNKPTLLKPGAEKLLMAFRVAPTFKMDVREFDGGHREITTTGTLTGPGGEVLGEGVGSCSTMESKYRYRNVADYEVQDCDIPKDSKEKKAEYRKKGFGMKQIDGQWRWVKYLDVQKTENPDIADQYNTVLKMSKKRALIDAVLTVFGASDIFTQDVEDLMPDARKTAAAMAEVEGDRLKEKVKADEKKSAAIAKKYDKPAAPAAPAEAPLTIYEQIQRYRKQATQKGPEAIKKLDGLIDQWLCNVVGKSLSDCTEAELLQLHKAINEAYAPKKDGE